MYVLTYLDIKETLCYKMHAPFLIDNSIDIALKNFSYTETNIVQDYQDKSLNFSSMFQKPGSKIPVKN